MSQSRNRPTFWFWAAIVSDAEIMNQQLAERNPSDARFVYLDEDSIAKLIDAKLTAAEYRLFLALTLVDPFGNAKVTTNGELLRKRLSMSKATYYRSIAALQEKELFDFDDVVLRVRNRVGLKSPERKVSKMRPDSQKRDDFLKNETEVSEMRKPEAENHSEQGDRDSPIDLSSDQDFSEEKKEREASEFFKNPNPMNDPQSSLAKVTTELTVEENKGSHTATCFELKAPEWTNFSAPGADPKFFDFVCQRAAKFDNPVPVDVKCAAEGWIRKQGHILHREYLDWQEEHQRRRSLTICEPPAPLPPPEPTQAERQANALARLRVKYRNPKLRAAALVECEEWGFTLTDLGVSNGDG